MELALTTQLDEMRSINTTAARQNAQAGWLRTGKLWSGLNEVCDLLRIATGPLVADSDFTFQHDQFKTGQRNYTIGQPFDHLYIVNSGFLKTVLIGEQSMVSMLGSLSAEARVARFLVLLSDRFTVMGYSGKQFNLRLTRHD